MKSKFNNKNKNMKGSNNKRREERTRNKEPYKEQNKKTNRNKEINIEKREEKIYDDIVCGRNAVKELLKEEKDINKVWIQKNLHRI